MIPQPTFSTNHFKRLVVLRFLTENCLVFLLQYIGLMFSVFSSFNVPINVATGTATAFIFMRGYTILPGLWLGTFVAYYFSLWSMGTAGLYSNLYALQTFLLFWLSLKYIGPSLVFNRFRSFVKFLLLSAVVCCLVGTNFSGWLSSLLGILIIGPAIAAWDLYFPDLNLRL